MTATTGKYVFDTSSASSSVMVRKHDHGETYEEESERIPYDPIPKGQYALEITGFQAPFEMPRPAGFPKEEWQSDMVTKTRLEYTVLSGDHAGAVFLGLYTLSFGERATLGQTLRAINQGPLPRKFDLEAAIGWRFSALVIHSKDKNGQVKVGRDGNPFPEIVIDSIEPIQEGPERAKKAGQPVQKPTPSAKHKAEPSEAIVGWSDFWTYAKSYGFSPQKGMTAIEAALGEEPGAFAELPPDEVKRLLAAHVGDDSEVPF